MSLAFGMTEEQWQQHAENRARLAALLTPQLPEHNPDAACPKCGADAARIAVSYHSSSPDHIETMYLGLQYPCSERNFGEHLCRTCSRCGYAWQEQTVNSERNG